MTMAFDKQNVIDQEEVLRPQMVSVEIAGKTYQVPEGITMIKALWYTGQEVIRGAGCWGGFCGAAMATAIVKRGAREKSV
jgi:trehalose utilization protein